LQLALPNRHRKDFSSIHSHRRKRQTCPGRHQDQCVDVGALRVSMKLAENLAAAAFDFQLDAELLPREVKIDSSEFGAERKLPHEWNAIAMEYLLDPALKAVFRANGVAVGFD